MVGEALVRLCEEAGHFDAERAQDGRIRRAGDAVAGIDDRADPFAGIAELPGERRKVGRKRVRLFLRPVSGQECALNNFFIQSLQIVPGESGCAARLKFQTVVLPTAVAWPDPAAPIPAPIAVALV